MLTFIICIERRVSLIKSAKIRPTEATALVRYIYDHNGCWVWVALGANILRRICISRGHDLLSGG